MKEREVGSVAGYDSALKAARVRERLQVRVSQKQDSYLQYRIVYRELLRRWFVVEQILDF